MKEEKHGKAAGDYKIIVAGVICVLLFWLLESAIHYLLIHGKNYAEALIYADTHEIWMRIIVVSLIASFTVYAYRTSRKDRIFSAELSRALEIADKEKTRSDSLFMNMLNSFAYHKIVVDDDNNPVDYIFLEVNKAFERHTGLRRNDIIGKRVTEAIPGIRDSQPDIIRIYGDVALTGNNTSFEFYFVPFGKWYSVSAYCPEPGYFVSIFEDITERKNLEKALIEIEERERRSLGHDLHDGLGQLLTGLAFKVRGLGRTLEKNAMAEAEDVADMSVLIDEAKEQVSYLSRGLAPAVLDEDGLMNALKSLCLYTKRMFGISCTFECETQINVSNGAAVTQLYRIAQEAVTNAVKHAGPEHIHIAVSGNSGNIVITITDDGKGMPADIGDSEGMGMKIMKYRAGIISASLDIHEAPAGGTIVSCIYPGGRSRTR